MPKRSGKPLTPAEKRLRSDGALCVTFVNTGSGKRGSLEPYDDLLAWGFETRLKLKPAREQRKKERQARDRARSARSVRFLQAE